MSCSATNHVTNVNLTAQGLSGTLPATLGNLPYLSYLNLADNALSTKATYNAAWVKEVFNK